MQSSLLVFGAFDRQAIAGGVQPFPRRQARRIEVVEIDVPSGHDAFDLDKVADEMDAAIAKADVDTARMHASGVRGAVQTSGARGEHARFLQYLPRRRIMGGRARG